MKLAEFFFLSLVFYSDVPGETACLKETVEKEQRRTVIITEQTAFYLSFTLN